MGFRLAPNGVLRYSGSGASRLFYHICMAFANYFSENMVFLRKKRYLNPHFKQDLHIRSCVRYAMFEDAYYLKTQFDVLNEKKKGRDLIVRGGGTFLQADAAGYGCKLLWSVEMETTKRKNRFSIADRCFA